MIEDSSLSYYMDVAVVVAVTVALAVVMDQGVRYQVSYWRAQ